MTSDPTLRMEMRALMAGKTLFDEPMARHTSMGVGGNADVLVSPRDVNELRKLLLFLNARGIPYMPVGNGTNLIVRDGGYRGALISLEQLQWIEKHEEDSGDGTVTAGAGTLLWHAVEFSLKESLSGLEFLAGIPGSVGGAVRMNAGARGHEIKDVVHAIELMNHDGTLIPIEGRELHFEYRQLVLSQEYIITGATFKLTKEQGDVIRRNIASMLSVRRKEQPLDSRSAGCIFKNPAGGFAGKLIDDTGLKGRRVGDAYVSDLHANYIINRGNASARDIVTLIAVVQHEVGERFGVRLETEVHIIGEDRD